MQTPDREGRKEGRTALIINAALLFRMQLHQLCDHVVFVKASLYSRFLRSKQRDSITLKRFLARERAQKDIRPDVFPLPFLCMSYAIALIKC